MCIKKIIFTTIVGLLSLTACGDGYVKYETIYVDGDEYRSEISAVIYTARYEVEETLSHHTSYTLNNKLYIFFYDYMYSNDDFSLPESVTIIDAVNKSKRVTAKLSSKTNKYINYQYVYYSQSKRSLKIEEGQHVPDKAPNNKDMQEKTLYLLTGSEYHYSSYTNPTNVLVLDQKEQTTYVDLGNSTIAYRK